MLPGSDHCTAATSCGTSRECKERLNSHAVAPCANGKNKTLTSDIGVDIGPNHIHGGVSGGALGYDAFYQKKKETKYKKEEI